MTQLKPMHVRSESGRPSSGGRSAFSLIEVLVAVTLMSVIVLGLLTMFSQTQRAFRAGITQVDVMESGRAACEMIARELEQTTPTRQPNSLSFFARWNSSAYGGLVQLLPGKDPANNNQWRTNVLQDVVFATRENQTWSGIGYFVLTNGSDIVGTLYRYETNVPALDLDRVASLVPSTFAAHPNHVIDGVVHFRVLAYDSTGYLITPNRPYVVPFNANNSSIGVTNTMPSELSYEYHFRSNAVPAYLELEIGVLEAKTAARARNLPLASQMKYLESKVGNVQVFRQRIPIRNVDPSVYQ